LFVAVEEDDGEGDEEGEAGCHEEGYNHLYTINTIQIRSNLKYASTHPNTSNIRIRINRLIPQPAIWRALRTIKHFPRHGACVAMNIRLGARISACV
jgi:hypothetical protein